MSFHPVSNQVFETEQATAKTAHFLCVIVFDNRGCDEGQDTECLMLSDDSGAPDT